MAIKVAWPQQPNKFEDLNISEKLMENLILKTLKRDGKMDELTIARKLKVSALAIREIIQALKKRKVLDTPMPLQYYMTELGKQMEKEAYEEDAYVGPCPVNFQEYADMVNNLSKYEERASLEEVKDAFSKMTLQMEFMLKVKEAYNAQRPILLYGPPGNGKSLISNSLHALLKNNILVPFAFEFNSMIVNFYDPAYHKIVRDPSKDQMASQATNSGPLMQMSAKKDDPRWLEIKPPLVIVGTEFRVKDFDIAYDGKYEAPPLVKANNGIFVVDDLGRQVDSHVDILNQFIYPLEALECIIRMAGGSRLIVPYKQRLFVSTNLNKEEIIDDAFNRRLLYQFKIDKPAPDTFVEIFVNVLRGRWDHIPEEQAVEFGKKLMDWYKEDNRILRGSDPRNLSIMLDATLMEGETMDLTMDLFRRVYDIFPMADAGTEKQYGM